MKNKSRHENHQIRDVLRQRQLSSGISRMLASPIKQQSKDGRLQIKHSKPIVEENANSPKFLYKYAPLNNFSLQAIANGHFWYSKLQYFNDPFEPKAPFHEIKTTVATDQLIQAGIIQVDDVEVAHINNEYFYERSHHDAKSIIDLITPSKKHDKNEVVSNSAQMIYDLYVKTADVGVLCLSSDPKSILMWSHYSDNHKGICIQIERTEDSLLSDPCKTYKVAYDDNYPNVRSLVLQSLSEQGLMQRIIATKGKYWSYEEEWRVIQDQGNKLYAAPGKITGVIFGLRTTMSQKAAIMKLLSNTDILTYEVARKEGKYEFDIRGIPTVHEVASVTA